MFVETDSVKKGVNILVVDDEAMVRDAIKRLLEHGGHVVVAADSGPAALSILEHRKFDVIITDFSMPGMQGDQLVSRIREQWPDQRIIMATAFVEEYKVFGEASGRVDYLLLKPFSLKDLHNAIETVLTQRTPSFDHDAVPPIVESPAPEKLTPPPEP
jgi:CheY-like chemotaxis protein